MDIDVIRQIDKWLANFRDDDIHFTFHGGEPLLAGYDFYKEALPILAESQTHATEGFSLQSNLWLLDEKYADLSHSILCQSAPALMVQRKSMTIKEGKDTLTRP